MAISVIGIALHSDRRLAGRAPRTLTVNDLAQGTASRPFAAIIERKLKSAAILSVLVTFGRHTTSSISEQIAYMMSTTEKALDLDVIGQRLDRLGVRL